MLCIHIYIYIYIYRCSLICLFIGLHTWPKSARPASSRPRPWLRHAPLEPMVIVMIISCISSRSSSSSSSSSSTSTSTSTGTSTSTSTSTSTRTSSIIMIYTIIASGGRRPRSPPAGDAGVRQEGCRPMAAGGVI